MLYTTGEAIRVKSFLNTITNNIWVSVILGGIFIVIAVIGYFVSATDYDSLTAVADDGVISSVDLTTTRRKGRTKKKYRAIVTFTDSDHRTHKVRSIVTTSSSNRYEKGKHVSVRYDPWNPDAGCLIVGDEDLVEGNRLLMFLFVAAAGVCFILAVLGLVQKRRRAQDA